MHKENYLEIAEDMKMNTKSIEDIKYEALYKLLSFLDDKKIEETTNLANSLLEQKKRSQKTNKIEAESFTTDLKKIELLFDCLRAPYDIAHIAQIALALDCQVYTSGNCVPFDHPKVKNKIKSWNIESSPETIHYESFEEAIQDLKNKGRYIVGTSGEAKTSYYDIDFSDKKPVIVFGTESTGLSQIKRKMVDELVKMPMAEDVDFLTLPVVVSAIAYDLNRQFNLKKKN